MTFSSHVFLCQMEIRTPRRGEDREVLVLCFAYIGSQKLPRQWLYNRVQARKLL